MKCSDIKQFTDNGSYKVNVTMRDLIRTINKDIEVLNLKMQPDFQRNHVWTDEQQIAYLEYFLKGGKSGTTLYFNNPSWGRKATTNYNEFVCVDGLQRITAIQRFLNNEIPVFNTYYKDFEDTFFFDDDYFHHSFELVINDLQTKEEVLTWYLEMNSGGTPHTKEELDKVKNLLKEEKANQNNDLDNEKDFDC